MPIEDVFIVGEAGEVIFHGSRSLEVETSETFEDSEDFTVLEEVREVVFLGSLFSPEVVTTNVRGDPLVPVKVDEVALLKTYLTDVVEAGTDAVAEDSMDVTEVGVTDLLGSVSLEIFERGSAEENG